MTITNESLQKHHFRPFDERQTEMATQSCRQIRNNTTEKDEFYPRYINKIKLISLIIIQYIYSNDRNENFILLPKLKYRCQTRCHFRKW